MSINFTYPDPFTEDTAENRLKHTFYLVEADSFAQHVLWARHAADSRETTIWNPTGKPAYEPVQWEQECSGWGVQVGELAGMPLMIGVNWARIEGRWVCFWYQMSAVTDCRRSEEWLTAHFPRFCRTPEGEPMSCDAAAFHSCLSAIEAAKQREEAV